MAKIYITERTLRKLESVESAEDAKLLKRFDPNRPEKSAARPKKVEDSAPSNWHETVIKNNRDLRRKKALKERRKMLAAAMSPKNNLKRAVKKPGQERPSKKKAELVKKVPKNFGMGGSFIGLGGTGVNTNKSTLPQRQRVSRNNSKPLALGVDYNDIAAIDSARILSVGGGRKKNKEWNDMEARKLRPSLRRARKRQQNDPNLFDRQAVK